MIVHHHLTDVLNISYIRLPQLFGFQIFIHPGVGVTLVGCCELLEGAAPCGWLGYELPDRLDV